MFLDQQSLCDWAHDTIALHPFRRPTEAEREAAHRGGDWGGEATARRLGARRLQDAGFGDTRGDIDVLEEGRASTFDTKWPGSSSAARAGLAGAVLALALLSSPAR